MAENSGDSMTTQHDHETPEQKAKRIGVPLIPKNNRPYTVTIPINPSNPTVSVCGECGLEIKQVMGYCCPKGNCPAGLGGSSSAAQLKDWA